jgi:CRP-like cAMP-binding protein
MFITTFDEYGKNETENDACHSYLDGDNIHATWRWGLFCECHCTIGQLYVAALYWSTMTLTTIGYGDVSPANAAEMVFMVIAMLLGAAVFSFVVGTCCSLVEGLDKMGLQFQEEFDAVNDYMHICGIDKNMRRRVRAYVWNYKDMSSRRNEGEILGLMSPALQQEFILHNYGSSIRAIPALHGAPDSFVVEMAHRATRKLYGPRDTITYQGAIGDPFYLLRKGEVIICRSPGPGHPVRFVQRLQGSGFWNERLLMFNSYADCTTKSMTFVEVVAFESEATRQILNRYPNGRNRVKQNVLRRLWRFSASRASIKHAVQQLRRKGFGVYDVSKRASLAQGKAPPGRSNMKVHSGDSQDSNKKGQGCIPEISNLALKKARENAEFPFGYVGDGGRGEEAAIKVMSRQMEANINQSRSRSLPDEALPGPEPILEGSYVISLSKGNSKETTPRTETNSSTPSIPAPAQPPSLSSSSSSSSSSSPSSSFTSSSNIFPPISTNVPAASHQKDEVEMVPPQGDGGGAITDNMRVM